MNTDVSVNVVVFQLRRPSGEQAIAHGPTQAEDCVRQAWAMAREQHQAAPWEVTGLHCEWEPSEADKRFVESTFTVAMVTFNFSRPGPAGWEAAFAAARQTMAEREREQKAAEDERRARVKQDSEHVAEHGQLLPIIWSHRSPQREMLEILPNRELVPGRIFVTVATVARTPQGKIGMHHTARGGLKGRSFVDLMETALEELSKGLRIEGRGDPDRPDLGPVATLRRDGPFAASAIALPGFHQVMSDTVGADRLVAGLMNPDTLFVAPQGSNWDAELKRELPIYPCPEGPLIPTLLSMTSSGYTVLAER